MTGRTFNLKNSSYHKYFESIINDGISLNAVWPYMDQRFYMIGDVLTKVDRASMRNSLEVRTPFLDHELTEFINTLPNNYKLKNGQHKYILRSLLSQYIPVKLWDRPKKGFGCPYNNWLKKDLQDSFISLVLKSDNPYTESSFIIKMWQAFLDNGTFAAQLWTIYMFEYWRKSKKAYF